MFWSKTLPCKTGENQLKKNYHERIHTSEDHNNANIMRKDCLKPVLIKMHEIMHTGEMPYECR